MTAQNNTKPLDVLVKARQFFLNNPDEMLTREDFQVKFECTSLTAGRVAKVLIREGVRRDQLPRAKRQYSTTPPPSGPFPHNLKDGERRAIEGFIAHGTISAAAVALGLSYFTTETYLRDARRKAGVHSTPDLVDAYEEATANA